MTRILGLVALVLLAGATTLDAQDLAAGQAAYAVCAACHGANAEGNKSLNAPALAGQEAWYLERQLQNFRAGIRGGGPDAFGAQMAPMAASLADDEAVKNVAAYISSLSPADVTHDGGGDATAGQTLFATCVACHGPEAMGNQTLNAPNLTIQQDWYLIRQLKNFKSGARGAHPQDVFGAQMRPMAAMLADDAAIANVAAYIASLGN